jgi:hypothetical protein
MLFNGCCVRPVKERNGKVDAIGKLDGLTRINARKWAARPLALTVWAA